MRRASGISFDGLAGSVSAQLLRVLDQMCGVVPNRSLRRSEVRSSHRISKIRLSRGPSGKLSVVCPHCKAATRFRGEEIERRQVVLT
jgi:hypothetical protein